MSGLFRVTISPQMSLGARGEQSLEFSTTTTALSERMKNIVNLPAIFLYNARRITKPSPGCGEGRKTGMITVEAHDGHEDK